MVIGNKMTRTQKIIREAMIQCGHDGWQDQCRKLMTITKKNHHIRLHTADRIKFFRQHKNPGERGIKSIYLFPLVLPNYLTIKFWNFLNEQTNSN